MLQPYIKVSTEFVRVSHSPYALRNGQPNLGFLVKLKVRYTHEPEPFEKYNM